MITSRSVASNYQWRPWFAWHPVRVNASWVWLRRIERRDCNPPDAEIYWEYRLAEK